MGANKIAGKSKVFFLGHEKAYEITVQQSWHRDFFSEWKENLITWEIESLWSLMDLGKNYYALYMYSM